MGVWSHRMAGVRATILLVAAAIVLGAFAARYDRFFFDVELGRAIQRTPGVEAPAEALSSLGGSVAATLVGLGFAAACWRAGWIDMATLALLAQPARALNWLWKEIVDRERPGTAFLDVHQVITDGGYPSGHASSAVLVYGVVVIVALTRMRGPARLIAAAAGSSAVLLIGVSRVALGVHWPSDVLGGWVTGAATLAVLTLAVTGRRREPACGEGDSQRHTK